MKFCRYGAPGEEKPALIGADGVMRDLSDHVPDLLGGVLHPDELTSLGAIDSSGLPAVTGHPRLGPPIVGVGKFICVGLNYADHAAESGLSLPDEPVIFFKATSAIVGPNDDVEIPRGSVKTDWEVELGVVIGCETKYVTEAEALDHVAGYCVVNDLSERDFQLHRSGQWVKGKSADTFGPIGPWLVTKDEVPDPQALRLWLEVDGEGQQDGTTATMIFRVPAILAYLSRMFALEPGDVVATGTPPGVGAAMTPPRFLRAGQTMVTGIAKLGRMRNAVRADD